MRRMTPEAIDLSHIRYMRFVTILTVHQRTMLARMAFAAIKLGMLIRVLLVESLLIVVTGNTDRLDSLQPV